MGLVIADTSTTDRTFEPSRRYIELTKRDEYRIEDIRRHIATLNRRRREFGILDYVGRVTRIILDELLRFGDCGTIIVHINDIRAKLERNALADNEQLLAALPAAWIVAEQIAGP